MAKNKKTYNNNTVHKNTTKGVEAPLLSVENDIELNVPLNTEQPTTPYIDYDEAPLLDDDEYAASYGLEDGIDWVERLSDTITTKNDSNNTTYSNGVVKQKYTYIIKDCTGNILNIFENREDFVADVGDIVVTLKEISVRQI